MSSSCCHHTLLFLRWVTSLVVATLVSITLPAVLVAASEQAGPIQVCLSVEEWDSRTPVASNTS